MPEVVNPNHQPPTVEQLIAQHRSTQLYNTLATVRQVKVTLFLLDMDAPLEPKIAEVLRGEFESMAALCIPKVSPPEAAGIVAMEEGARPS